MAMSFIVCHKNRFAACFLMMIATLPAQARWYATVFENGVDFLRFFLNSMRKTNTGVHSCIVNDLRVIIISCLKINPAKTKPEHRILYYISIYKYIFSFVHVEREHLNMVHETSPLSRANMASCLSCTKIWLITLLIHSEWTETRGEPI